MRGGSAGEWLMDKRDIDSRDVNYFSSENFSGDKIRSLNEVRGRRTNSAITREDGQ